MECERGSSDLGFDMLKKKKRLRDRGLLDKIKLEPCLVCGHKPCDPAHVKSVGAGGDDVYFNVIALCRPHHTEQHQLGVYRFVMKYTRVRDALAALGWEICCGRVRHSNFSSR